MALRGVCPTTVLGVPLKPGEEVDMTTPLKRYIATCYQQDPREYEDKLIKIQNLRKDTLNAPIDDSGVALLYRYHGQFEFLAIKFPLAVGQVVIPFKWQDAFSEEDETQCLGSYERACVLFNLGALQATVAAAVPRSEPNGAKIACTYLQAAAGCFAAIKTTHAASDHAAHTSDLSAETLAWLQDLSLAQAQECMIERSCADGGKPSVLTKLCFGCATTYEAVHNAVLPRKKELDKIGPYEANTGVKAVFFRALAYYYRGLQAQGSAEHGLTVAMLREAVTQAKAAAKLATKHTPEDTRNAVKAFVTEAEAALASQEKDNSDIYHELIPTTLPELQGIALAKPTPVPSGAAACELAGPDIFNTLVPLGVLTAVSLYSNVSWEGNHNHQLTMLAILSEEKAQILRHVNAEFAAKTEELSSQLAAMGLPQAVEEDVDTPVPERVARAAAMLREEHGVEGIDRAFELVMSVSGKLKPLLDKVVKLREEELSKNTALRAANPQYEGDGSVQRLARETEACVEAYSQALVSHSKLHHKFKGTSDSLTKMCADDLESSLAEHDESETNAARERLLELMAKVDQMKTHRKQVSHDLRAMVDSDDITDLLVHAREDDAQRAVMDAQLRKYDEILEVIRLNIDAQDPLLKAVMEANAVYAQAKHGGEHGDRLRELENAAATYFLCKEKLRDADQFWSNFERMLLNLERGWAMAAKEREKETDRLGIIMPKRPPPPTPTRASKPVQSAEEPPLLAQSSAETIGYNPHVNSTPLTTFERSEKYGSAGSVYASAPLPEPFSQEMMSPMAAQPVSRPGSVVADSVDPALMARLSLESLGMANPHLVSEPIFLPSLPPGAALPAPLTHTAPPPPTANAPPLPDAEAAFVSAYGKFPRPALQPPTQPTEQPAPAVAAQQGSMHHHHQRPHWTQHTAPQFTGYGEHPQYTDYAGQQQQQQQYYHPSQPSGQPATPQAQPVVQSSPQHVPSQFVAPSQPPQPQRLHSPAANIQQPYMAPAYAHYPQGSMPPQQAHPAVAPQTLPEHSQQRRYSLDPLIPQHSSTVSHESVTQHQQHAGHAATVDAFQQPQHPQPTQSSPAVPQHQQPPHQWPQPQGASAPQPTQQQHYQARQTPTNMPQDPFSPPPPRAVHQSSTMYAPPPPPPQPQSQAPQPHRQHYYSAPQAMPPVAPVNGGPAVYGAPALAASYQYNAGPAGAPPQHAPPQHTPYTATQPGPMNPAPNGAYNHALPPPTRPSSYTKPGAPKLPPKPGSHPAAPPPEPAQTRAWAQTMPSQPAPPPLAYDQSVFALAAQTGHMLEAQQRMQQMQQYQQVSQQYALPGAPGMPSQYMMTQPPPPGPGPAPPAYHQTYSQQPPQ